MGLIATNGFQRINDEIQFVVKNSQTTSSVDLSRLNKWRSQHALLCDYVDQYNQMFNIPLLVEFFHVSLCFVYATSLFIDLGSYDVGYWYFPVVLSQSTINLYIMCSTGSKIKRKVFHSPFSLEFYNLIFSILGSQHLFIVGKNSTVCDGESE